MIRVAVCFSRRRIHGSVAVRDGKLAKLHAGKSGRVDGDRFTLPRGGRLEITLSEGHCRSGSFPTIVTIHTEHQPFSFNVRDVRSATPVWIPELATAVVPGDDDRTYDQIETAIRSRNLLSDFERFDVEPEWSYEQAARMNRAERCPTWLGLGRDIRMFRVHPQESFPYWGIVQPFFHDRPQSLPDQSFETSHYELAFVIGHGSSCRPDISRRIEEGALPILRSVQREHDLEYQLTAFATLETEPLRPGAVRGSDWRACYARCAGCMLSDAEQDALEPLLRAETWEREQEVVCCLRVEAVNTGRVPRFAWFRAARARPCRAPADKPLSVPQDFRNGTARFETLDRIFAVHRLEGEPMPDAEMAVLVQPGAKAVFDLLIPHSPLPPERASALMRLDVDAHLDACRAYWRERLETAASIHVPEAPIDESIRAGLLHCDLVAQGLEPDGTVAPTIGGYAPIGTESAPIIQVFDCFGWHGLAERCLQFFFDRQRPDGFIQNFARYESETGPLLWTAGEHYRYTRDRTWLERVTPNLRRAAQYLLRWRERNRTDEQRARGCYGMVDGKVADPDDYYHSFFLNAGTYLGLKRTAEMLRDSDPDFADRLATELPGYRDDIRAGFAYAQARAPVVPLPDGSWAPMLPPWVEQTGATSLFADGGNWFSHGAFASRSCLTGPLWLIIGEVLEPHELETGFLLKTNQYPVTLDNAALSQPYYCRHDYAHLRRGETAAFLRLYYNQLTALQDRETHTFWEHFFGAGQHKTHEEAWFLMQTRWMLYMEQGRDLAIFPAIPRHWLAPGREIAVREVRSYFGTLSFCARCNPDGSSITAEIGLHGRRRPRRLRVRLPHSGKRHARACRGGDYDASTETVIVTPCRKTQVIELKY